MKRALAIVVLASMVLHCCSRLGVISFLYSKRHDIAYQVGLTAEIPIAMCNGEYFAKQAPLVLNDHQDQDEQSPSHMPNAKEIQLFVLQSTIPLFGYSQSATLKHNTLLPMQHYSPPDLAIFHPPCERVAVA